MEIEQEKWKRNGRNVISMKNNKIRKWYYTEIRQIRGCLKPPWVIRGTPPPFSAETELQLECLKPLTSLVYINPLKGLPN
jgi:hypothetical protein